ncbi:TylF/MycF family methyltransferase [Acidiferrimicrobium sp. IK]|uniref:TylF/MycF family methyltransferase n=1 Tax=Acidiferrimicrobium sp. IK TaxID=2871700 RepID=UPI0021CAE475|nr:TylF/MycF family methyltransferase [Acidiferrimicrobium sp. IK]MCU4183598.1 TylF/MycF family methyltransferase [Acidiferrimicrobium sp. IK]
MRPPIPEPAARYLELLAGCLTRDLFIDEEVRNVDLATWPGGEPVGLRSMLRARGWRVVAPGATRQARSVGNDWPPHAETMIGLARLANVLDCTSRALADGVPGDLVETGVWRGGTSIYLRAILAALGDPDRRVWACDSFEGLPEPDAVRYPQDVPMKLHTYSQLAVGLEEVKANFARYGLLDDRVRFVPGWFRDTLPALSHELGPIAVLRLDGDLYESTIDALASLEPKVSPGGFVIVDDYGGIEACRDAVSDYRADAGIDAPIQAVDWTGAWWRKP